MKVNSIQNFLSRSTILPAKQHRFASCPIGSVGADTFIKSQPAFKGKKSSILARYKDKSYITIEDGNDYDSSSKILTYYDKNKDELGLLGCRIEEDYVAPKGLPEYYLAPVARANSMRQCLDYLNVSALEAYEHKKGIGTKLLKEAVKLSLNPKTEGRVMLHAVNVDNDTSPLEFYHKLGFRCVNVNSEHDLEYRLKHGIEIPPDLDVIMYLPAENISQLLNYSSSKTFE